MPYNPNRVKNPYSSIEELMQSVPKSNAIPVKLDLIIMKKSTEKDWDERFSGINCQYPIFDAEDHYDSVMDLAKDYQDGYLIYFGEDTFAQCVGLYPKMDNPLLSKGHDIKGPRITYDIKDFHYDGVDMLMFHYIEPCACMSFALLKGPKAKQLSDLMSLDPVASRGKDDCWNRCRDSEDLICEYLKSNFNINWKKEYHYVRVTQ